MSDKYTRQGVRDLDEMGKPPRPPRRKPGEEPTPCPRCGSWMPRGCACEWKPVEGEAKNQLSREDNHAK